MQTGAGVMDDMHSIRFRDLKITVKVLSVEDIKVDEYPIAHKIQSIQIVFIVHNLIVFGCGVLKT